MNTQYRNLLLRSVAIVVGLSALSGCAGISDFDSWAPDDVEPASQVAVFAPADAHADARRLEDFYCQQITEVNRTMSCEVMTVKFPVGQEISEDALQTALSKVEATHLVTIRMLESTPRTNTNATLFGDFVWGHNTHHEENLHEVQILNLSTNEIAYSAQLRSNSGAALTRGGYLNDFARRVVRDQDEQGAIAPM